MTLKPGPFSGDAWRRCGLLVAVLALICGLAAGDAFGCPNCKDAVNTADPEGLNVARGYFYSILLMLAMPFTLAGSFGIYVWREMRRQRQTAAAASGSDPASHWEGGRPHPSPTSALP